MRQKLASSKIAAMCFNFKRTFVLNFLIATVDTKTRASTGLFNGKQLVQMYNFLFNVVRSNVVMLERTRHFKNVRRHAKHDTM